jgi:hypothetical protein
MTAGTLSKSMFAENLHTRFHVHTGPEATVELELIELSEGRANPGHEVFSLTFRGPLDAFLGQGMVSMAHDAIGEFDLFIVPIAQISDGFLYEAVFNR